MVRPRRYEQRQAQHDNLWGIGCFLSCGACIVARSGPGKVAAGIVIQDVEEKRHRTGRVQLSNDASRLARLSTATRNRRIDLLPLSLHSQSKIPANGRVDVARLR